MTCSYSRRRCRHHGSDPCRSPGSPLPVGFFNVHDGLGSHKASKYLLQLASRLGLPILFLGRVVAGGCVAQIITSAWISQASAATTISLLDL